MFKNKLCILLAALALTGGCSDSPEFPRIVGNLENIDGSRISVFHLLAEKLSGWEANEDVHFLLVDPSSKNSYDFTGSIYHNTESGKTVFTCRLNLGATEIPDGTYFVSVAGEDIPDIGLRTVRFTDNIGTEEEMKTIDYSDLDGSGTQSDPYLISSQGDFLVLLSYLIDDPNHAYGRYFKQTRSFELPRRSQIIDGKVWAAVSFSGNYDGDGHRLLNLVYQGASDPVSDSGIGLFKDIYAATISNLPVTGALLTNTSSEVGIIAGSASGKCTLENISVEGTVMANGNHIGGFIGHSEDNLILRNVSFNSLALAGDEGSSGCVGALIGLHENGDLTIEGVSAPDHIFSLTGFENVGGLVGGIRAAGKRVSVRNAVVQHSVDTESAGVKIIHGSRNIGGLIGGISEIGSVSLSDCQVKAPVSGSVNTGGLAGSCASPSSLTVEKCVLSSVVSGEEAVGGFFGRIALASQGTIDFNGDDNASRLVLKSSAAAEVTGQESVGGLIGYLDGNTGRLTFGAKVEIAVNVNGSDRVGGALGYVASIDVRNTDNLNFSSPTMKVIASGHRAGAISISRRPL